MAAEATLEPSTTGVSREYVGAWLAGFVPCLWITLAGGGFDPLVSGRFGLAFWWVITLGAATAILLAVRAGATAAIGLGALVLLAAWAALSATWATGSAAAVQTAAQLATYAGAAIIGYAVQRAVGGWALLQGVASAIGVVALLAVGSRILPSWYPPDTLAQLQPDNAARLSYPLNYWNGLGALVAMGLPLLLAAGACARRRALGALAVAAVPVVVLCLFLTQSRGGMIAAVLAIVVLLVFARDRLAIVAAGGAALPGSVLVLLVASSRTVVVDGPVSGAADGDTPSFILWLVISCALAAALWLPLASALRRVPLEHRPRLGRTATWVTLGVLGFIVLVGAIATDAPGRLDHAWERFTSTESLARSGSGDAALNRLGDAAGNGRWQFWQSASDAFEAQPLRGIGSGGYGAWWSAKPKFDIGQVQHAHSVFMETAAELGLVGLVLLALGLGCPAVTGAHRAWRGPPASRDLLAAALAGFGAFIVGVAIDWSWALPAVPVAGLLLGAVLLGTAEPCATVPIRIPTVIAGILAILLLVVSLAGTGAVRDSQSAARAGDLPSALDDARSAAAVPGFGAAGRLQAALVLQTGGRLAAARSAAAAAAHDEPDRWQPWFVLAGIEARLGNTDAALAALRRARALNPTASFLQAG